MGERERRQKTNAKTKTRGGMDDGQTNMAFFFSNILARLNLGLASNAVVWVKVRFRVRDEARFRVGVRVRGLGLELGLGLGLGLGWSRK